MTTDASLSTDGRSDPSVRTTEEVSNLGTGNVRTVLLRLAPWLLVLIPYLIAWWLPFAWSWNRWTRPSYLLFFQPFVPLLTVWLVWAKRERILQIWRRYGKRSGQKFWVRGNALVFIAGCVILAFAHLVQIKGLAVVGLVLIPWGIVYNFYGARTLRALGLPIALSVLTIPPPDSIAELVMKKCGQATLSMAGFVSRLIKVPAYSSPDKVDTLIFPGRGYTVDYLQSQTGLGMIALNILFLFCLGTVQERSRLRILLTLLLNLVLTAGLNLIRVVAAGLARGNSAGMSDLLAHNWFVIFGTGIVALGLTLVMDTFLAGLLARLFRNKSGRNRGRSSSGMVTEGIGQGIGRAGDLVATPLEAGIRRVGTLWRRSERGLETGLKKIPGRDFNPFGILLVAWKRSERAIEKGFRLLFRSKKNKRRRY